MIISNREYTNFSSFESYFLWCRRRFYRFYRLGCEFGFDMLCTHDIITHCYECTGDGYADLYCKFATQQSCKHYHSMFCKSKRHMPSSSFFVLHFVSRPLSPPDRVSPDQNPASCVLHALHYHLTYKNKKTQYRLYDYAHIALWDSSFLPTTSKLTCKFSHLFNIFQPLYRYVRLMDKTEMMHQKFNL